MTARGKIHGAIAAAAAAVFSASGLAAQEQEGGWQDEPYWVQEPAPAPPEVVVEDIDRREPPHLVLGAEFGAYRYTGRLDDVLGMGSGFELEAALQVVPAFAIGARYFWTRHSDGRFDLDASGPSLEARFSIPFGRIRPFLGAGLGWYSVALADDGFEVLDTPSSTQLPIELGFEVLVVPGLGIEVAARQRMLFAGGIPDAELAHGHLLGLVVGARAHF